MESLLADKQAFTYLLMGVMVILLFGWMTFLEKREIKDTKHPKR